jgi:hypothetical protein
MMIDAPPKRLVAMMKIEPVLAEVGELLAILTIKLGSATVEEMPALIDEANERRASFSDAV